MEEKIVIGEPKVCCQDPSNLELNADHPDAKPDLSVRVCRVCGARHFELSLDTGHIGLKGAEAGG